jgi:hypothetical protein
MIALLQSKKAQINKTKFTKEKSQLNKTVTRIRNKLKRRIVNTRERVFLKRRLLRVYARLDNIRRIERTSDRVAPRNRQIARKERNYPRVTPRELNRNITRVIPRTSRTPSRTISRTIPRNALPIRNTRTRNIIRNVKRAITETKKDKLFKLKHLKRLKLLIKLAEKRGYIYTPDLAAILYGTKATKKEVKQLTKTGRLFTGYESRKLLR